MPTYKARTLLSGVHVVSNGKSTVALHADRASAEAEAAQLNHTDLPVQCQNPDCDAYPALYVLDEALDEWFPVCQTCWQRDYQDAPTRNVTTL